MEILQEKDGVDTELLVYAMTLINKVTGLCCFLFLILSILLTELKLDPSHFSQYDVISPFSFLFFLLQTLAALPDQDSFYDMVDGLEEQGMEAVSQRHLGRKGTDLDLVEQLNIYEVGFANQRHSLGLVVLTSALGSTSCFVLFFVIDS